MRFTTTAVAAAAASCTSTAIAYTPADTSGTDQLAAQGLANLKAYEKTANFTCSTETAHVRKEWNTLSDGEKKEYIDAVLCLQSKPAISGAIAPGAKSRYDDFVATHINQTLTIHGTVWEETPPSPFHAKKAQSLTPLTPPGQLPNLAPLLRANL